MTKIESKLHLNYTIGKILIFVSVIKIVTVMVQKPKEQEITDLKCFFNSCLTTWVKGSSSEILDSVSFTRWLGCEHLCQKF